MDSLADSYLDCWRRDKRASSEVVNALVSAQREPLRALRRHSNRIQVASKAEPRHPGRWKWQTISARKRLPIVAINLERFYLGQAVALSDPMLAQVAEIATLSWLKLSDLMTDDARRDGLSRLTALARLAHLELGDPNASCNRNADMGDEALRFIGSMAALKSLVLCCCTNITDAGLAPLGELRALRRLSLSRCSRLTGSCLRQLCSHDILRELDLSSCIALRSSNLKHLRDHKSLRRLSLRHCSSLTGARALQHVGALSGLEHLDLSDCPKIRSADLEHLTDLRRLSRLELRACHNLTDAGLARLGRLESLTHLDLRGCSKISDDGLAHLGGLAKLTHLDLGECEAIADAGLQHLRSLTGLRTLHLHCARLTPSGLECLRQQLPDASIRWTSADAYWDAFERAIGCS